MGGIRSPESDYAANRTVPIRMLTSPHDTMRPRLGPDDDPTFGGFVEKPVRLDVLLAEAE